MYSTYNEEKSYYLVIAERFIRALKNKIFKHLTAVSKNLYFDVLDNIVNKNNNTVHRTIKMKPVNVTSDSYSDYNEDSNKTDSIFKVDDHVRISKYKTLLLKNILKISQKKILLLVKIKTRFRGHMQLVT